MLIIGVDPEFSLLFRRQTRRLIITPSGRKRFPLISIKPNIAFKRQSNIGLCRYVVFVGWMIRRRFE